jgi:hypothetical protein
MLGKANLLFVFIVAICMLLPASVSGASEPVSFSRQVYPIIATHCLDCHKTGAEGFEKSGLNLETYEGLMTGTKFGPIIVPGDAFMSNFNAIVEGRTDPSIQMPFHGEKLRRLVIDILHRWVDQGALNN